MENCVLKGPLALCVAVGTMDDPQAVTLADLYPHHYGDQGTTPRDADALAVAA